jgi:hypothetical protein
LRANLKWLAQSTIYRDSVDLLGVLDDGVERDVAQRVEFTLTRVDRHSTVSEPTMELTPQSAKSLMQALWDAGIRPDGAKLDNPAEVAAQQKHIRFAEEVAVGLLARLPVNGSENSRG